MQSLNSLLLERKNIEESIIKKEEIINGTSLNSLKDEISVLVSKRFVILSSMDYLQKKARNNSDKDELNNINAELIKLCSELSVLDEAINEKQSELKKKEESLFSVSPDSIKMEIAALYEKLQDNTEKVGKKREEDRLIELNNSKNDKKTEGNLEQIWIDQTFGAYIWYNKIDVINTTMKEFFNYASKIDNDTLKQAGFENGIDSLYSSISNPMLAGLPSLLSMGIDLLIKTLGSFVKNFIAIKNAIDMLAGLDIAEIIGTCIPAAIKIMEDIKLFLSDTPAWMFKNMMSPLFDINIPIPAFSFDMGSIIPALPFMLNIPKIDNLDFFTKLTPFSLKCGNTDVDKDWYKEKPTENDAISGINKDNYNDILTDIQNKINKYNSEIHDINDIIENSDKNNVNEIDKINNEIKDKEDYLCSNGTNLSDNEIDNIVGSINDLYNKKKDYGNLPSINKDELLTKIDVLRNKIKILETKKKTLLKTIANSLSVSKNIKEDDANTVLDSLLKIGVNVNDNNNLLYIQKIGYNFKDDTHIEKLKTIKSKGIDISDTKLLKRLFDIGFNLNSPSYLDDLDNMKKFGIDIKNTEVLYMLCDIGFNLNNKSIFKKFELLSDSKIDLRNKDILYNINNIGFNFNNENAIPRLSELSKLADLSKNNTYDILIQKNININNPFFSDILTLYKSMNITIGDVNMKKSEELIFKNTDYKVVDKIIKLLDLFKINDFTYRTRYYTDINFVQSFEEYGITGDYIKKIENDIIKNSSININNLKDIINQYSDYGLEFPEINKVTKKDTIITGYSVCSKFTLFKDYIKNKKFVINGKNVNESVNEDEMKELSSLYGFTFTNNINEKENEINTTILGSIFGNFDKIGLNSKDKDFKIKIKSFTDSFKLNLNEIAVLDTKKNVYMETKLKKNKLGGYTKDKTNKIDLSKTKIDPELLEDDSASFITENVLTDGKPVTTKTIAKFDSINKLGFNYQQPDYMNKINALKSYGYDISHYDTPMITENLVSIGLHLTDTDSLVKLKALGDIGFRFNVGKIKSKIQDLKKDGDFFTQDLPDNEPQYTEVTVSANIGLLNNLGFNFNNQNYKKILSFLKTIGINLSNEDCQEALNELNNFGINFNDTVWETKTEYFKKLDINFSSNDWNDKMSNIRHLGLDFNGKNWLDNYNTIVEKRSYGLDYNDINLRKKISILSGLGIDFSEAPDVYKDKVEALIDLGLVTLSSDLYEQRKNEYNVFLLKKKELENLILLKEGELIDKDQYEISDEILNLETKNNVILSEITSIKQLLSISQNEKTLNDYSIKLTESCLLLNSNESSIKELKSKLDENKKNKNYDKIRTEITELKLKYSDLKKPKPYKRDGYKITISELEKVSKFDTMGVSFLKDNWRSDIDTLLKKGLDFSKDNWAEKCGDLKDEIQPCPQLAWLKMIKKVIMAVVTAPVNIIFGLIKQLLKLVKSIVSLPLNPVKIPDFAKSIIANFKGFIKMMMKLPSLKGITDFLFLDLNGLKLIDMFLPGFADFFGKSQKKNKNCSDTAPDSLSNKLKDLKLKLSANNLDKQNKIEDATDAKNVNLNIINNKPDNYLETLITKRDNINNNMNVIKEKSKNEKNKNTLKSLESELVKMCTELDEVEILINNYKVNKANITPSDALKNINYIDTQLNEDIAKIDTKTNDINKAIKKLEEEIKANGCSKCFCCMTDGEALELFKQLSDETKNKKNEFDDKLKDNENKIKNLEDKLTDNGINQKPKSEISDDIKKKEAELCLVNNNISDIEKDKLISEINDMYNVMKENNKVNVNSENNDAEILKQIEELKKENAKLKEESKKFETDRNNDIMKLNDIMSFIPVAKNVICYTPKFIANIVIAIFNSAGYMKNLPTLWEFPLIE